MKIIMNDVQVADIENKITDYIHSNFENKSQYQIAFHKCRIQYNRKLFSSLMEEFDENFP